MQTVTLAVLISLYLAVSRLIMRRLGGQLRELAMAAVNLAGVAYFLYDFQGTNFPVYVLVVLLQYVMMRLFSQAAGGWPWVAFFSPIVAWLVVRYLVEPAQMPSKPALLIHQMAGFVGISYQAFRCSRLVLEIRNGLVKRPGLGEYLTFAFFLPTMSVGPINSYANFRRGFEPEPYAVSVGRAVLRILVGLVKYQLLSAILGQLIYSKLLLNGFLHPWSHLFVAMAFYLPYLYCNFSGFCDMAIGAAALIGIPVPENFDNPLLARNMREFWNRWHITLSVWMRDVLFAPLSKYLVGLFGPARANHAIALTITIVFLLVGIWHGVGWNFAAFGLAQALGVVAVHYYTIFLKQKLGRAGFKAYNENQWIQGVAVVMTFCYFAATLFLFANTVADMKQIFSVLR